MNKATMETKKVKAATTPKPKKLAKKKATKTSLLDSAIRGSETPPFGI